MRHSAVLSFIAAFSLLSVCASLDISAQTRRTAGGTSSVQRRETASQDRRSAAATQTRRETASQDRRGAAATQTRRETAAQDRRGAAATQTRRETASQDRRGAAATQTRRETASQDRRGAATTQTRRETSSQDRRGAAATQTRRETASQDRRGAAATQTRRETASQTGSGVSFRRAERRNTTTAAAAPGQESKENVRNVTVNSNVTRRGLAPTGREGSSSYGGRAGDAHVHDGLRMRGHDVMRVPPRDRDFMTYDRIGRFWGGDPHYFGYRIETLPPRCVRVRYYGVDYYRYGSVYYRPWGGIYIVSRPPVGIVIDDIISDMVFSTVRFAFYSDVYRAYSGFDSYSRYIDAQNRRIARNNAILARQNEAMALNSGSALSSYDIAEALGLAQSYAYADREYYYSDGVFYIMEGGRYQTIVPPAGALVDELPDDYGTITLGGAEYYRVDDTVYRVTLIDGHPYLEVLGQMYGRMARQNSLF